MEVPDMRKDVKCSLCGDITPAKDIYNAYLMGEVGTLPPCEYGSRDYGMCPACKEYMDDVIATAIDDLR